MNFAFPQLLVQPGCICRHLEDLSISTGLKGGVGGLCAFPTVLCSLTQLTSLCLIDLELGPLPLEISQLAKLANLNIT